jgi:hypothetical protein
MKTFFRRTLKIALAATAIIVAGFAALYVWLFATTVSAADLPPLKTGDIIFQTSGSSQSAAILTASRSPYTHMGLIDATGGKTIVYEAVGPVKATQLDEWIKRGLGDRITIMRVKNLSSDDAAKVLAAARAYDGLPYDIFFLSSKDAIYCSELVELAFRESIGLKLGEYVKARDLHIDGFAARRLIERRWRKHPLCQPSEKQTFETCYAKILEQELVTPSSIADAPELDLVFSNYGALTE